MEVTPDPHPLRRVNYLLLSLCLVFMAASLAVVIWVLAGAYHQAETDEAREMFTTWIALAAGLLGLVVLLLGWVVLRWMRLRLQVDRKKSHQASDHPDAWVEAGRRIEASDDEE
jgi:uncharacterized membrane protein YidH (DUF202 family)